MKELKTGDIIQVHGWIMLRKIEARKYLIKIEDKTGWLGNVVWFYRIKNDNTIDRRYKKVGHYDSDVFPSIRTRDDLGWNDNNKIEIIHKAIDSI